MTVFIVGVMIYVTERVVHHLWEELNLIGQIQQKRDFVEGVWSLCFHSSYTRDFSRAANKEIMSSYDNSYAGMGQKHSRCGIGYTWRQKECVPCPQGTFALEEWAVCVPILSCNEMSHAVQIGSSLYNVGSWKFHAARWNNYDIMYAASDYDVSFDFDSIQELIPHDSILYPIGMCKKEDGVPELLFASNSVILGSAHDLNSILSSKSSCDNAIVRFKLAIDYVQILARLHSKYRIGDYEVHFVLCNSHSLSHLLSQLLVTADLKLILGALDNLPLIVKSDYDGEMGKIVCSQAELSGDFIAPEQSWPYQSSKVFNPSLQPGYNEKADIWKIPDVTKALLGNAGANVLDLLEVVHRKCKTTEPSSRPTAEQVLYEYQFVWKMLTL